MKKREGEVEEILDLAGSVIADKGFQGSGYVTPANADFRTGGWAQASG
jgi:hypothetical protein